MKSKNVDSGKNVHQGFVFPVVVPTVSGLLLLAWNGLINSLSSSEEVGLVLGTLAPIVNTALIVGAVVFLSCWIWFNRKLKKITEELRGEEQEKELLETQLVHYRNASEQVQVAVDVDDYIEVQCS